MGDNFLWFLCALNIVGEVSDTYPKQRDCVLRSSMVKVWMLGKTSIINSGFVIAMFDDTGGSRELRQLVPNDFTIQWWIKTSYTIYKGGMIHSLMIYRSWMACIHQWYQKAQWHFLETNWNHNLPCGKSNMRMENGKNFQLQQDVLVKPKQNLHFSWKIQPCFLICSAVFHLRKHWIFTTHLVPSTCRWRMFTEWNRGMSRHELPCSSHEKTHYSW